ncbi:hypothetical protein C8Q76DRAFT_755949, partial [Earliella scabrosa]
MQLWRGLRRNRGKRTTHIRRRLGFARRQPSSESLRRRPMVRRRTSPYRSDDSQPFETEALYVGRASSPRRTGFVGWTIRTQRGCMRLAVAGRLEGTCPGLRDLGGCVCDKASGRQARDDIGPTLARFGSRPGTPDRRCRATSTPAS